MTKPLTEPSQLVTGMSHKEMLTIMADAGIFCSHDRFARILQDAQRRALAAQAKRELALTEIMRLSEEMGAYDLEPSNGPTNPAIPDMGSNGHQAQAAKAEMDEAEAMSGEN